MAISYTKKMLVTRIQTHMANNFPNDESSLTSNQVLLYIDQALAFNLVGQVWMNAKLEGSLSVPEAYLNTYILTGLSKDQITGYWSTLLPQPPVSLPLGYSITDVYFAKAAYGKTHTAWPIESKRVSYREELPMPSGLRYWVEGQTIFVAASNGASLLNESMYVKMVKTRTASIDEALIIPDDAVAGIFDSVVKSLTQRYGMPQDQLKDDLPAGSKAS